MRNKHKYGTMVIVCGPGERDEKFYVRVFGKVVECDPYFKDYRVKFMDGTDDWFLPEHVKRPYPILIEKGAKKYED